MELTSSWVIGGLLLHAAILNGRRKFETSISNWDMYSPSFSTRSNTILFRLRKLIA